MQIKSEYILIFMGLNGVIDLSKVEDISFLKESTFIIGEPDGANHFLIKQAEVSYYAKQVEQFWVNNHCQYDWRI